MKKLIVSLVFIPALLLPTKTVKAQFVVFDPTNFGVNQATLIKNIKQLVNMAKQLRKMKKNLTYTINQYNRMLKNLRKLPSADWSHINSVKQNLKTIRQAYLGVQYMSQFIENRYRILYDTQRRLSRLLKNPEQMKRILQRRKAEHLNNQANKVIAASTMNLRLTDEAYQVLREAREAQNLDNLTPMQMKQIQAKVMALNTKQLIELKRIVGRYAAFSARKYRMAQANRVNNRARMQQYNREFRHWNSQFMSASGRGGNIVPAWATEDVD